MKRSIFIAAITTCIAFNSYSQDTTRILIKPSAIKYIGIYGDVNFQYGQIKNAFTPIGGASLMVLLNKKFGAGITVQQSMNRSFSPSGVSPLYLHANMVGLKLEYITNPNAVVHFSFPLIVGMGTARTDSSYHLANPFDYPGRYHHGINDNATYNRFFVVQPGVQAEANLLKFMKLYTGINYRFSTATENDNALPSNTLQGLSVVVGLKVGLFEIPTYKKKKEPIK